MMPKKSLLQLARALEGLPILGCLPGSPSALAGIGYGDVLISVNGQRTRNIGEYVEAKGLRKDGMEVVVFRAGSERMERLQYSANHEAPDFASIVEQMVAANLGQSSSSEDDKEPSLAS